MYRPRGTAWVRYVRKEAVERAVDMLHGTVCRSGSSNRTIECRIQDPDKQLRDVTSRRRNSLFLDRPRWGADIISPEPYSIFSTSWAQWLTWANRGVIIGDEFKLNERQIEQIRRS